MKNTNIPKHQFKYSLKRVDGFDINSLSKVEELRGESLYEPHTMGFYILIHAKKASGILSIDFKQIVLRDNIIIPVALGQVIQYDRNVVMKGDVIKFTSDFLLKEKVNLCYLYGSILLNPHVSSPVFAVTKTIKQQVKSIIKAFDKKSNSFQYEELLRCHLKILIINLESKNLDEVNDDVESDIFEDCYFYELLNKRISYRLKVVDIADELKITPKKLNRLLKKKTGRTTKSFIDERLILEIKRLLVHSDMTIKEIAYQLHFDEVCNMSNYFKRHTSISPLQFRNESNSVFL
ncbi:helix-turn-helix domain-containing protein [Saccharicrinis aurantiacus]|uniref:helix-turn-helix domain-containing protein n=1 Tax=Saccharicrinis aurantiacus TaxID=1849719 RepID=UPI0009F9C99B|nr:helix-turn-helix transcriptional regulator [Saccharicrinis aurantiacus]